MNSDTMRNAQAGCPILRAAKGGGWKRNAQPIGMGRWVGLTVACAAAFTGCRNGREVSEYAGPPEQQERFAAFRADAEEASLAVMPIVLVGEPNTEVARVVALLLERAGMKNLSLSDVGPATSADKNAKAVAEIVATFVQAHPIDADYALFAEYVGTPATGVAEVRAVVVDRAGRLTWLDSQKPGDADFKRLKPDCPMTCSVLLADRLRTHLGLKDPNRRNAPEGKIAQAMKADTGLPSDAEQAAMTKALTQFKQASKQASVAVYPVCIGDAASE